jgi:excisionase family DNA binding protein
MNIQAFAMPQRLTFSPMEVAVVTGLSISTVHRRLAAGEIKFSRSGRRVLIPRYEIDRLCLSLEHAA